MMRNSTGAKGRYQTDGLFQPLNTSRSLTMALLRAREALMSHFRPMLHSHDITEQQWRVIRVLAEAGELETAEVAARASILGPSLSRIVRTLEARKLISKRRDPEDGRRYFLSLTAGGNKLIEEVMPDSQSIYAELEKTLGKQRIEDLLVLLNDVSRLIKG